MSLDPLSNVVADLWLPFLMFATPIALLVSLSRIKTWALVVLCALIFTLAIWAMIVWSLADAAQFLFLFQTERATRTFGFNLVYFALSLSSISWFVGLYDSASRRRWRWVAVIVLCMGVSWFVEGLFFNQLYELDSLRFVAVTLACLVGAIAVFTYALRGIRAS